MSFTLANIHFTQGSDKIVYASGELLRRLKLTGAKSIQLKLGQKTVHTPMRQTKRKGKHLYLPSSIRQSVRVPKQGAVLISSSKPAEVHIGPLIGILTNSSEGGSSPFGSRTGLIRSFLMAGAKRSYYFAFTPRDVDWSNETVYGYFLSNGGWVRKTVPLPDVVYNRLTSRKGEVSPSILGLKDRFVKRNIPFFNWSFFNKADVYRLLEGEAEEKYVPESHHGPNSERIREMLEKHQFVYLKPTGGSLGNGIFRLTYHPKRGYFARFRRNGQNVLVRFTRFQSLMQMLQSRSRLRNYIVQQGIRLIEIDGCPIDFRFHMNKNGSGNWVVSGIGAKKAGRGSVTTHVKSGGQLMTPEQALHSAFGSRADEVLQKARQTAIKLAEAIDRKYPHLIGELGFDLGVDRHENVWMFEANAKPGRSIFKHPALKQQGIASLRYIYEYCLYLSSFRSRRDE